MGEGSGKGTGGDGRRCIGMGVGGKGTGGDGRRCIGMEGWEVNGMGWKEVHRDGGVGREREGMEGGA